MRRLASKLAITIVAGSIVAPLSLSAQQPPPPPPQRAAAAATARRDPEQREAMMKMSVAGAGTISFALLAPIRHADLRMDAGATRLLDSLATLAAADRETPNAVAVMKQVADSLGRAIVAVAQAEKVRTVTPAIVATARKRCASSPLCDPPLPR